MITQFVFRYLSAAISLSKDLMPFTQFMDSLCTYHIYILSKNISSGFQLASENFLWLLSLFQDKESNKRTVPKKIWWQCSPYGEFVNHFVVSPVLCSPKERTKERAASDLFWDTIIYGLQIALEIFGADCFVTSFPAMTLQLIFFVELYTVHSNKHRHCGESCEAG
jgi:hypothetical protein